MKKVIILETNPSVGGLISRRCAFWLPVMKREAVAIPQTQQSAWRDASAEEVDAIRAGDIVEEIHIFIFGVSLGESDVHKLLQIAYDDRLGYLESQPPKGQYYGAYLDESGWNDKPVKG